jgi:DNA-3-methyladenine glycosylase
MKLQSILSLSPDKAAPLLLGSTILTSEGCGGIIVEVEAYLPADDPASHSYIGKTNRNQSMFMDAGTFYVYTLRHHSLANIVTEGTDRPGAILIRAIEPTEGIELMKERRGVEDIKKLCNGPAKLCQALGITKKDDGMNIFDEHAKIRVILPRRHLLKEDVCASERIGISKNRTALLRFSVKGSRFVSRPESVQAQQ